MRTPAILLLLACLALPALTALAGCGKQVASVPESDEALHNWHQGRTYQAQGRYELAREHYLLALAAARSDDVRDALAREVDVVDRQIKTLR